MRFHHDGYACSATATPRRLPSTATTGACAATRRSPSRLTSPLQLRPSSTRLSPRSMVVPTSAGSADAITTPSGSVTSTSVAPESATARSTNGASVRVADGSSIAVRTTSPPARYSATDRMALPRSSVKAAVLCRNEITATTSSTAATTASCSTSTWPARVVRRVGVPFRVNTMTTTSFGSAIVTHATFPPMIGGGDEEDR